MFRCVKHCPSPKGNAGLVYLALVGLLIFTVVHFWADIMQAIRLAALTVLVLIAARLVYAGIRFAILPREARKHWHRAVWAQYRWRWLAHNLQLAYVDKHRRGRSVKPVKFGTSVAVRPNTSDNAKVRFPRAKIRPDVHGLVATIKTVPGVGRTELEDAAEHIANAWGCHRAQVSQPNPGKLIVRGLRTDPLTVPFGMADAPAGVFNSLPRAIPNGTKASEHPGQLSLYVGRDEWGNDRYLPIPGTTGIAVGGLPGYGKTSLTSSWLCQLADNPAVQFVFIDGKGGGDYSAWEDRAWIFTGDELPGAANALEDVHSLMRLRLAAAGQDGNPRNRWHVGPTPECPLIITVLDECHTFFDLEAVKGVREAEAQVRACRSLTGQLVRKGRSVLFLTILITQKQTSDAVPTAIRDNCRYGLSFAVKTKEASVAVLGEQIRQFPTACPTTLQDPGYIGVATASLRTGNDPFVRLRVPEITEAQAAERAADSVHARRDPMLPDLLPVLPEPVQPDLSHV